jgi:CubicO group peptidase (beta-lactamase class C family)
MLWDRMKRVVPALLAATWLSAAPARGAGGGALAWFPGPCDSSPGGLYGSSDDGCGEACLCPGDCNGDGHVAIDELVSVVTMAMNGSPPQDCPAVDRDSSCDVSVDEVVDSVNGALKGCPPLRLATRSARSPLVDFLVDASMIERGPGAVVLVAEDGEVLHEVAYGFADLKARRRNETDTPFAIGQVSMPFTALAVLMLADDGLLDLDDPVGLYVPRLERFGERLTIRTILSHTSGIPDFLGRFAGYGSGAEGGGLTNAELVDLLWWWGELQFEPGTQCRYSQVGYEVLATLVETVAGVDFPTFIQQRILDPLGMEHTYVRPEDARLAEPAPATGYVPMGEGEFFPFDLTEYDHVYGAWSMYSTARDLLRFDQALYTDRLVSTELLAQAFAPASLVDGTPACADSTADPSDASGLGWQVGDHDGEPYAAHDGFRFGYTSHLLRFPERRLTVIVLADRTDSGLPELAFRIADLFLGN